MDNLRRTGLSASVRGAKIGRYHVLDRLGEGGMGVVYAAYDPELDRKIALKLLNARLGESPAARDFGMRLQREAQAMARLSHPNVVSVHDVGTFEDKVFVAMEFVDGRTLSTWVKEKTRSWREVLAAFRQAGMGLAAAHSAGLIHRDFKPANVLVGRDESVKVTDFGLAKAIWMTTEPDPGLGLTAPTGGLLQREATAIGGTPGYMAPEQLEGKPIDARADQYSFCVALYEALFGERPGEGETLAAANSRPDFTSPAGTSDVQQPAGSKIPPWVSRPILRALNSDREKRFRSMDELLGALTEPRKKWRRALAVASAFAILAASVFAYRAAVHRQSLLCRGAENYLRGVWDEPRRSQVRTAFVATGKPYALATFETVKRALDQWSSAWVAMHTEACEATRLRGEQSEALLDLRMGCLQQRLDEIGAVTHLLAQADAQVVEKAVEATQAISPLHACADVAALTGPLKLPDDPTARAKVEKHRKALAEVKALRDMGKYSQALKLALETNAAARESGYKPLEAESVNLLGELQQSSGDPKTAEKTLYEAIWLAEASRHDEVKAEAWTRLVHLVGYRLARTEDGHHLERHAAAAIQRVGNPPALYASLQRNLGALLLREGKFDDSIAHLRRALEIRQNAFGSDDVQVAKILITLGGALKDAGKFEQALEPLRTGMQILEQTVGLEHPNVADCLTTIGAILRWQGKLEAALEAHQRALKIREQSIGPDSERVGGSLMNIGTVFHAAGRNDDALEVYQRALAIREKALGPEHPDVAATLANIADIYLDQRRYRDALVIYKDRTLPIFERAYGPDHPEVAWALDDVGGTLYELGDLAAALRYLERGSAIREKRLGPEHIQTATSLDHLGSVLDDLKHPDRGLGYHQRALAIVEKALGPENVRVVEVLVATGRCYTLLGQPTKAVTHLERALNLQKLKKAAPVKIAETEFYLGRALWNAGQDRKRALALLNHGWDTFRDGSFGNGKIARDVQEWFKGRSGGRAHVAEAGRGR